MRRCRAAVVFALATIGVSLAMVTSVGSAQADPIGGLVMVPGEGVAQGPMRMRTSGPCPKETGSYYGRAFGHGFPEDGQVVTPNTTAGLSKEYEFDAYMFATMADYAKENKTDLRGEYKIVVYCVQPISRKSYGEFVGSIAFGENDRFEAVGTAKPAPDKIPPPVQAGQPPAPPGDPATMTPNPQAAEEQALAQMGGDTASEQSADVTPVRSTEDTRLYTILAMVALIVVVVVVMVVNGYLRNKRQSKALAAASETTLE